MMADLGRIIKMKKKAVSLLLVTAMAATMIAGCGNKAENGAAAGNAGMASKRCAVQRAV